ncbi:otospiralin isoform X1 [Oryx dammah]|uniref:otospiralin isoform X1 n=1 Tax=Oryx dammah TaxID=59534 RepID=UPI001A9B7B5E|nr:otospiralin isoform X1 [Oryx dammah]
MPACLLPGLALCLLLAPLAGAKPVQEEGGTVLLSSLVSGVVWVLFLVLGAQSRQKGGPVAVGLWPKLVKRKPWVSWRSSPRRRGTGASSLGTHQAGGTPCAPQDQACPPQTPV